MRTPAHGPVLPPRASGTRDPAASHPGRPQLAEVHRGPGAAHPTATGAEAAAEDAADAAAAQAQAGREGIRVSGASPPSGGRVGADPAAVTARLGAGVAVPEALSERFSTAYGSDLSGVRLHPESAVPADHHALALTVGEHVAFAPGRFRPGTPDGDYLFGHELAHVVQQRSGGSPAVQRWPDPVTAYWATVDQPLAAYSRLAQVLDADAWSELNNAATWRQVRAVSGPQVDKPAGMRTRGEVTVSVRQLFEPATLPGRPVSWRAEVFEQALRQARTSATIDAATIGQTIEAAILHEWLDQNPGALDRTVRIALIDPEGLSGGAPSLVFQIEGIPLHTLDGALYVGHLDRALGGNLHALREEAAGQLSELTSAVNAIYRGETGLAGARELVARPKVDLIAAVVEDTRAQLQGYSADLAPVGSPYSDAAMAAKGEIDAWLAGPFATFEAEFQAWRTANPPRLPSLTAAEREFDGAVRHATRRSYPFRRSQRLRSAGRRMAGEWFADLFSGGSRSQEVQLHQAYQAGQISLRTYTEASDAVRTRGNVMLGLTAVLTIVSLGTGGLLAPVGSGLLRTVTVFGAMGALEATVPMAGANLYTYLSPVSDPAARRYLDDTSYSGGDFLLAGAVGFGLGGGLGAAGWLYGNWSAARALARAANDVDIPLPALSGATATRTGTGSVRVSVPGEAGYIEVTREGWTVFGVAGDSPELTALMSGMWADEAIPGMVPGSSLLEGQMGHVPFQIGVGQRGWGLHSPTSSQPFQFGLWDDVFVPGGGASRTGTALDLLDTGGGRGPFGTGAYDFLDPGFAALEPPPTAMIVLDDAGALAGPLSLEGTILPPGIGQTWGAGSPTGQLGHITIVTDLGSVGGQLTLASGAGPRGATALTPDIPADWILLGDGGGVLFRPGSAQNPHITPPPRVPLMLDQGNPTTHTLSQIRRMRQPLKWQAGEQWLQEIQGSPGQMHFPVPVQGGRYPITGTGGRFVDSPVIGPRGIQAGEAKTYHRWFTNDAGQVVQGEVPLSDTIRQQVHKDVWLRDNLPGYDPIWHFLDAPPSADLSALLRDVRITHVLYD